MTLPRRRSVQAVVVGARFVVPPQPNPYHSGSTFTGDDHDAWFCANHSAYVVQGRNPSRALLDLLGPIHAALSARVSAERARLGYNVAALGFLRSAIERGSEGGGLFGEALSARAAAAPPTVSELRRKTAAREKKTGGKRRPKQKGSAAE